MDCHRSPTNPVTVAVAPSHPPRISHGLASTPITRGEAGHGRRCRRKPNQELALQSPASDVSPRSSRACLIRSTCGSSFLLFFSEEEEKMMGTFDSMMREGRVLGSHGSRARTRPLYSPGATKKNDSARGSRGPGTSRHVAFDRRNGGAAPCATEGGIDPTGPVKISTRGLGP